MVTSSKMKMTFFPLINTGLLKKKKGQYKNIKKKRKLICYLTTQRKLFKTYWGIFPSAEKENLETFIKPLMIVAPGKIRGKGKSLIEMGIRHHRRI